MIALIIGTMKALAGMCIVAAMIVLVSMFSWRVVYYGFRCRKAPIQKTALLTSAVLWVISAIIINFA